VALQVIDPDRLTGLQLRWKLETMGYDVEKIDRLAAELRIDLLEILAGWAPILVEALRAPKKRGFFRRLLWWR
jgi:hypothetical protein